MCTNSLDVLVLHISESICFGFNDYETNTHVCERLVLENRTCILALWLSCLCLNLASVVVARWNPPIPSIASSTACSSNAVRSFEMFMSSVLLCVFSLINSTIDSITWKACLEHCSSAGRYTCTQMPVECVSLPLVLVLLPYDEVIEGHSCSSPSVNALLSSWPEISVLCVFRHYGNLDI